MKISIRIHFHTYLVGLDSQLAYYHLLKGARSSGDATINVI